MFIISIIILNIVLANILYSLCEAGGGHVEADINPLVHADTSSVNGTTGCMHKGLNGLCKRHHRSRWCFPF